MSLNCQFPIGNLSIDPDGVAPCCWSSRLSTMTGTQNPLYTAKEFQAVRKSLAQGSFPKACHLCQHAEEENKVSLRQRMGQKLFQSVSPDSPDIKILDITLDRVCPLACRMCSTVHSTSWDPLYARLEEQKHRFSESAWEKIRNNQIPQKNTPTSLMTRKPGFWKVLDEGLKTATTANLTGGEPLIHPDHNLLLKRFSESKIQHLIYHTSLNVPVARLEKMIPKWKQLESLNIKASVDDIHDRYERFRLGGRFKTVLQNLELLNSLENLHLEINVVIQAWNASHLEEILQFWRRFENAEVQLKPVDGPEFFRPTVFPARQRQQLVEQLTPFVDSRELSPMNQEVIHGEIQRLKNQDHSLFYQDWAVYNEILDETYNDLRCRASVLEEFGYSSGGL